MVALSEIEQPLAPSIAFKCQFSGNRSEDSAFIGIVDLGCRSKVLLLFFIVLVGWDKMMQLITIYTMFFSLLD